MSPRLVSASVTKVLHHRAMSRPWAHRPQCTEMSPEEEKEEQKKLTEQYQPLLTWLKEQAGDIVRDGKPSYVVLVQAACDAYDTQWSSPTGS